LEKGGLMSEWLKGGEELAWERCAENRNINLDHWPNINWSAVVGFVFGG
jgi:hypothetical protein